MVYAGVLELSKGKTYGRQIRANGKPGKLYYGVTPADASLPPLKVAFEVKHTTCSKYTKDKYISFELKEMVVRDQVKERPEVLLVETLGDVDDIGAFSRFRVISENMQLSSSFAAEFRDILRTEDTSVLKERAAGSGLTTAPPIWIFTIDPDGCKDMDDGVGLTRWSAADDCGWCIHIAITSVFSFLLTAGIDGKTLATGLRNTCSLYLIGDVINMLPKRFAEQVCSLNEGYAYPALTLSIKWSTTSNSVVGTSLALRNANVMRNYSYEETDLLAYEQYVTLKELVKTIQQNHRDFPNMGSIVDSHDVVAYLMNYMNYWMYDFMSQRGLRFICRVNRQRTDVSIPSQYTELVKRFSNHAGEYCASNDVPEGVEYTVWTHITSPMRRAADLTNQVLVSLWLLEESGMPMSEELFSYRLFVESSLAEVGRISQEYKSSRRISLDCDLVKFVTDNTEEQLNRTFDGIVMETKDSSASEPNLVTVYLPELGRLFRSVCSDEPQLYDTVECKLLFFTDEANITKKARLVLE